MKKVLFSVSILLSCCIIFSGCIKTSPSSLTINPSMTASIGKYNFIASSVVPSTVNTQVNDSITTLIITGYSSDVTYPNDKIVITVTSYKSAPGTWSIEQGQASGTYYHNGAVYAAAGGIAATGGVVSISNVTSSNIVGYFSFNTGGVAVTNGSFNVGLP